MRGPLLLVRESRARAGVVEDKAHEDRIPQLARVSTVVTTQSTFLDEAEALIELSCSMIVRPDLECDLVSLVRSRPIDDHSPERSPDAAAAVSFGDLHSQVCSPASELHMCLADELSVLDRDEARAPGVLEL